MHDALRTYVLFHLGSLNDSVNNWFDKGKVVRYINDISMINRIEVTMSQPRQRHVPLKIEERQELDRRKRDYEDSTGDCGDWGKFLSNVTLAGLAALGVYATAAVTKRTPIVWQVSCSQCDVRFPIQVPNPVPRRLEKVKCLNCSRELVVDFAKAEPGTPDEREDDTENTYTPYCHYCQMPIKTTFSDENQQGVGYLECPRCGRVPRISAWE